MRACHQLEIVTPKKVLLSGLWLGPRRAKRVVIFIHGLGGSIFSRSLLSESLVTATTAVLTFNNRGHDVVSTVKTQSGKRIRAGAAHEVFTDCVDDIEGAIRYAKAAGAKEIFLAGHSTGCQKSVYWASQKGKGVAGIILLAPISDYAAVAQMSSKAAMAKALKVAQSLIAKKRGHELLPAGAWHETIDAQRYVSMYSGDSAEEIFPYWNATRVPKTLRAVKLPVLAVLAEKDEYADRKASVMAEWFRNNLPRPFQVRIVPKVTHGFQGAETFTARVIGAFMKDVIL